MLIPTQHSSPHLRSAEGLSASQQAQGQLPGLPARRVASMSSSTAAHCMPAVCCAAAHARLLLPANCPLAVMHPPCCRRARKVRSSCPKWPLPSSSSWRRLQPFTVRCSWRCRCAGCALVCNLVLAVVVAIDWIQAHAMVVANGWNQAHAFGAAVHMAESRTVLVYISELCPVWQWRSVGVQGTELRRRVCPLLVAFSPCAVL